MLNCPSRFPWTGAPMCSSGWSWRLVLLGLQLAVAALRLTAPDGVHGLGSLCTRVLSSCCFLPPLKNSWNHLSFLSCVWFGLFLSFPFTDETCQWHFQYDCAQAKKTVCKLWEGKGALHQVFWTMVWVWSGGVCGAPHLPDVSLPAWTYKLIPQTHVTAGLHHCTAR